MLLNIDKILQLLSEGKDIKKISELSELTPEEISAEILKARELLNKFENSTTRKKIIIKRKRNREQDGKPDDTFPDFEKVFTGAELIAIPVESVLKFYIAIESGGDFYKTGIIICDRDNKDVGKLHFKNDATSQRLAIIDALEKSVKIADYFKASGVHLRIDDKYIYEL